MADVDYFLKIGDIEGESTKKGYEGQIEILSYSWGATNMGTSEHGSGAGAGKVHMQDFSFSMKINKATPYLMLACALGTAYPKAEFTARKAGGKQEPYLKIKMGDVMVSSYQTGGSGGDPIPTEMISLNFTKVNFGYSPQKEDGSLDKEIETGYDLKQAEKA